MKKFILDLIIIFFLLPLGSCKRDAYNERVMAGPFIGERFEGVLNSPPASSIWITDKLILEVGYEAGLVHPILRMRSNKGEIIWSRIMSPRREGESGSEAEITSITLSDVINNGGGVKIKISCIWTGGGKENGMLYLNSKNEFQSFSLSW